MHIVGRHLKQCLSVVQVPAHAFILNNWRPEHNTTAWSRSWCLLRIATCVPCLTGSDCRWGWRRLGCCYTSTTRDWAVHSVSYRAGPPKVLVPHLLLHGVEHHCLAEAPDSLNISNVEPFICHFISWSYIYDIYTTIVSAHWATVDWFWHKVWN